MRRIDLQELKAIQLEVLDALDAYCRDNGIAYSLSNGTLIGAVRHGGYIPWDDDVDVSMLRADYDRFVAEFPEIYAGHYKLGSLERDSKWDRPYAKLFDSRTVMTENRVDAVETGVNVDIFPIDEVPADAAEWQKQRRARIFTMRLYEAKDRTLASRRAWWKTAVVAAAKAVLACRSKRKLAERIDAQARGCSGCGSGKVSGLVFGFNLTEPFDASIFAEMAPIVFEDRKYMAFVNYDAYLSAGYGDYMQLPPEEKRVTHHKFVAYFKD